MASRTPDPLVRTRPRLAFPVVGVGASAGGFEAFVALLQGLPTDTGMAFILVQHMDPTHPSLLPSLLAKHCSMPVRQVTDGELIEPNQVYVVPSDARLTVFDGALRLLPRRVSPELHLPIDTFLDSLADECENSAVAVILSGTGHDGTRGVRSIKAEGGVTFAQDVESAKFPQMAASALASGCVDFCLPPAAIAAELVQISRQPYLRRQGGVTTAEDANFHEICRRLSVSISASAS